MSDLKFEVDAEQIASAFKEEKEKVKKEVIESVGNLASMTHAKTMELATENLGSTQKMYKDNLSFQQIEENMWVVSLDEKALWIEEGRKSGFMEGLLNGKSSKTNKKGEKYAVIPFEHSKNPSEQSTQAADLANQIKKELKRRKINYRKPEYNEDGSPKLGLIKRFNVESAKLKPTDKTGPLQNVSIYQRKDEQGKIKRDVMTFRIIHEKHREEGKWFHPGRKAENLMDKAFDWAMQTWENEILPEILKRES